MNRYLVGIGEEPYSSIDVEADGYYWADGSPWFYKKETVKDYYNIFKKHVRRYENVPVAQFKNVIYVKKVPWHKPDLEQRPGRREEENENN